jgi:hypothetical protein
MTILYILPIIIFVIVSGVMYMISKDPKKNDIKNIITRNVLPGLLISITVFLIIKFKDNLNNEPMMDGNYFD